MAVMAALRSDTENLHPGPFGTVTGHAVSLGTTALVTLAGLAIAGHGTIANIGLLYLLPVLVAATRYGLRTGIVTSLVCSLAYNFFFIPPTHTFTIEDPQNIVGVMVLLGVAIVASKLASHARGQALIARASAAQSAMLAGFARQLTGISTMDALAQMLCRTIGELLDGDTVLLVRDEGTIAVAASLPEGFRPDPIDIAAASLAFERNRPAGLGSDMGGASEWLFQPVGTGERVIAVFGIARQDAAMPLAQERRPLLESLLDQAGLALERIALEQEMAGLAQVRERDRLRHALLSSVSHDLRTPLTTILGTLGAMRAADGEQAQQLATTRSEAARLHRFVDNLLDMARIEAGALDRRIEAVDLSEAVAAAVDDMARTLGGQAVMVEIAPDLPLVMVDPQLFHHCLINLIDNAVKHGGPTPVAVRATRAGNALVLAVEDEGPGIPPGDERRIFETFARIEGSDRKGGTGLGLAIVKGFAEAMGLGVEAANRGGGPGASLRIRFEPAQLKELPEG
ncbi:MAG: DUF4118 domain-containing protein [Novosphingobium sp.]|nr:DUF4118 domain-containing protein [Novosphingobium sp.]